MKIIIDGFESESPVFTKSIARNRDSIISFRHVVSAWIHAVSAGLVGRVSSPEREGIWLSNLPRFIKRRHNCLWQWLFLGDTVQILRELGSARRPEDDPIAIREGRVMHQPAK